MGHSTGPATDPGVDATGMCIDAAPDDVGGHELIRGYHGRVAGSSAMPGCSYTLPRSGSLTMRRWGPKGSPVGGLGRSLLVLRGGDVLVLRAGLACWAFADADMFCRLSFVRRFCRDSLRGFESAGMLEMRSGISGGPLLAWTCDGYVGSWLKLGERRRRDPYAVCGEWNEADTDCECECRGLKVEVDVDALSLKKAEVKSLGGAAGEKFVRVVGFGALRDIGGFELGLSVTGESGSGVSDEKGCLPRGDVAVTGGERGIELGG